MPTKYSIEDAPAHPKYSVEDDTGTSQPSYWLDPLLNKMGTSERQLTEIQKPDPNAPALSGKEAVKAVGNIGPGGLGVLLHPINTAVGIGESVVQAVWIWRCGSG